MCDFLIVFCWDYKKKHLNQKLMKWHCCQPCNQSNQKLKAFTAANPLDLLHEKKKKEGHLRSDEACGNFRGRLGARWVGRGWIVNSAHPFGEHEISYESGLKNWWHRWIFDEVLLQPGTGYFRSQFGLSERTKCIPSPPPHTKKKVAYFSIIWEYRTIYTLISICQCLRFFGKYFECVGDEWVDRDPIRLN